MKFDLKESPHRRFNPLINEWILVSPHRTKRPWQGQKEKITEAKRPQYDPKCYLCPGNHRAGGHKNPQYDDTYIFTNDFAALLPDSPLDVDQPYPFIQYEGARGTSRVICFSPRHDLTLPEMKTENIVKVIDLWSEQIKELEQIYQWVQVFENKGSVMGCSNPHPHGQIWASSFLPNEIHKEDYFQQKYFNKKGTVLLLDYLQFELSRNERVVSENEDWVAIVPFWAVWPFEILVLPKRHVIKFHDLTAKEKKSLSELMKDYLIRYDNLFETSFPYSMGWHFAPANGKENQHWQIHAHYYPPLLRSATVKKFMVGYEMLAESQRDITAEQAATRLRSLPSVHYKCKASDMKMKA